MKFNVDKNASHIVRDEKGAIVFGGFSNNRSLESEVERAAEVARRWNAFEEGGEVAQLRKALSFCVAELSTLAPFLVEPYRESAVQCRDFARTTLSGKAGA